MDSIEAEGIRFGTGASMGAVTEKVRITQDGLVGIGYQTPTTPLRVSGTAAMNMGLLIPQSVTSSRSAGGNFIASGTTSISASDAGTLKFATGGSQRMVIDSSGKVGIGTTPSYNVHIVNADTPSVYAYDSDDLVGVVMEALGGTNDVGWVGTLTNHGLRLGTAGTARLTIDNSGNVGIGTTAPTTDLHLLGHMRTYGATSNTISMGAGGYAVPGAGSNGMKIKLYGSNDNTMATTDYAIGVEGSYLWMNSNSGFKWYSDAVQKASLSSAGALTVASCSGCSSDRRLKKDITDLDQSLGLDAITKLHPVRFRWKEGWRSKNPQYGFIAQDAERAVPDLVYRDDPTELTPDGTYLFNYEGLIAPLVLSIQQLKAENENLRTEHTAELKALRAELDILKKAMAR